MLGRAIAEETLRVVSTGTDMCVIDLHQVTAAAYAECPKFAVDACCTLAEETLRVVSQSAPACASSTCAKFVSRHSCCSTTMPET